MILTVGALMMVLPFAWMAIISFAAKGEVFSGALIPTPSLAAARDNYAYALSRAPLLNALANGSKDPKETLADMAREVRALLPKRYGGRPKITKGPGFFASCRQCG